MIVTSRSWRLSLWLWSLGSQQESRWLEWSREVTVLFTKPQHWNPAGSAGIAVGKAVFRLELVLVQEQAAQSGPEPGISKCLADIWWQRDDTTFCKVFGSILECFNHHSLWASPTLCAAVASYKLNCDSKTFSIQPMSFLKTTANLIKRHFSYVPRCFYPLWLTPLYPQKQNNVLYRSWMENLGQVWSCSSFVSKKKLGFAWPDFCQQLSVTGQDGGSQSCPVAPPRRLQDSGTACCGTQGQGDTWVLQCGVVREGVFRIGRCIRQGRVLSEDERVDLWA